MVLLTIFLSLCEILCVSHKTRQRIWGAVFMCPQRDADCLLRSRILLDNIKYCFAAERMQNIGATHLWIMSYKWLIAAWPR